MTTSGAWYGHWWPLLLVVRGRWWCWPSGRSIKTCCAIRNGRPTGARSAAALSFCCCSSCSRELISSHVLRVSFRTQQWSFPGIHFDQDSTATSSSATSMSRDQTLDVAVACGRIAHRVNPRGDVTVNGTSDDSRIHIALHKQIYSRSDSDADSRGAAVQSCDEHGWQCRLRSRCRRWTARAATW